MRRFHRQIAPIFALFLLVVALTGLATQATDLLDHPAPRQAANGKVAPAAAGALMAKPPVEKRSPMGQWNHWFKKIHSGEAFGPFGIVINIATGAALLFFSVSGFWMYLQMALRRWSRKRR